MKPRQTAEVDRLLLECDRQAENPPNVDGVPDIYISMFAVALKESLAVQPGAQEHFAHAVGVKKKAGPFPSSYAFNSLLRNSQKVLMFNAENPEEYDVSYPYKTQEEWNERVGALVSDDETFRDITYNMFIWNVGSDVETRIAGPKLVAHTMQNERVNNPKDPFTILIIGSAADHSLVMLSQNIDIPEVRVIDRGLGKGKQKFLQNLVHELLAREVVIGECHGVDVWPYKDSDWRYFLEACRYYPSELLDLEKRDKFRMLEGKRSLDPRIKNITADYGVDEVVAPRKDMVIFPTSMYQNYQEKRRHMFDRSRNEHIKAGGKIVVQDFCKIKGANKNKHPIDQLEFLGPTSKPYTYGTFVFDTLKPKLGFQLFGYWNNGRCEALKPGELLLNSISNY